MRWNCPHCGVNLAVTDDKLGAGWSFSRCYKCGGFALIRRAEVNLVKVDRAPAGEHIILPEATEEPVTLMSEEAMQNLARLRRDSAEKAAARAAMNEAQEAIRQAMAQTQAETAAPRNIPEFPPRVLPLTEPARDLQAPAIPAPLPEINATARKKLRLLPTAIGIAGAMTVASGTYLFIQGQALWEKARTPSANEVAETKAFRNIAANSGTAIPAPAIAARAIRNETSDQINHSAMAPVRQDEPTAPAAENEPRKADSASNAANTANTANTAGEKPAIKAATSLLVQPRAKNADLHTGPGSLYPIVGMANPSQQYVVTDWNDRWFRVILKDEAIKTGGTPPKFAWIRTDLVQVVPAGVTDLPPYPSNP